MTIEYTVAELRQNLRKALNQANEGHTVVCLRYGQPFLISAQAVPDVPVIVDKTEADDGTAIGPVESVKVLPNKSNIKFCKHDAVKGFCKRGCK